MSVIVYDQNMHFRSVEEIDYLNSEYSSVLNLAVNDMQDSVLVVTLSQDFAHCLFANKSFSALAGADINSDIKAP